MTIDAPNHSLPSPSYFQKSVTLQDWWLTKPQTDHHKKRIGVSGFTCTSQLRRCFCSAPILKAYDIFELETVDGICVNLRGYINKEKTLENGFSPEVFDHFAVGFPCYWEEFSRSCPKKNLLMNVFQEVHTFVGVFFNRGQGSIDLVVKRKKNEDSIHDMDMDIGVEDCKETGVIVSNKASSVSSLDIPHECITKTGELCETESEDVVALLKKNSKMNGLECLGSRRRTRSMTNMDSSKKDLGRVTFVVPENIEIARKDKDNASEGEGEGEQHRQRNKSTCQVDHRRESLSKDDDESRIDTMTSSDVEIERPKSDPLTTSIKASYHNNNIAGAGRGRVDVPGKEASKSKRKLTFESSRCEMAKRQHITSLKSPSTPTANQERYVDANVNVLSPESFSGKRSRSGRVLLPSLEFWHNQTVVYDAGLDRQVTGVRDMAQSSKDASEKKVRSKASKRSA